MSEFYLLLRWYVVEITDDIKISEMETVCIPLMPMYTTTAEKCSSINLDQVRSSP